MQLPLSGVSIIASPIGAALVAKLGIRRTLTIGLLMVGVALFALTGTTQDSPYVGMAIPFVVFALGAGFTMTAGPRPSSAVRPSSSRASPVGSRRPRCSSVARSAPRCSRRSSAPGCSPGRPAWGSGPPRGRGSCRASCRPGSPPGPRPPRGTRSSAVAQRVRRGRCGRGRRGRPGRRVRPHPDGARPGRGARGDGRGHRRARLIRPRPALLAGPAGTRFRAGAPIRVGRADPSGAPP